jgi:hypothetical protein
MTAHDRAAIRVASAIAAQDPLLGRDVIDAIREYLGRWGLESWDADPMLDHGMAEAPRIRRVQALGAALTSEVGDERADETMGSFIVQTPGHEFQGGYESDARERVREYLASHGVDATRRDVVVLLHIESTGTKHPIDVDRFLGDD